MSGLAWVVAACILVAYEAKGESRQARSSVATVNPADAAFGYTDRTHTRLLMLGSMDTGRAQVMETAVCSDGVPVPIRYVTFQNRSPSSNGRQSAGNLANDEGHLFELIHDRPPSGDAGGGETCLMLPAGYLRAYPLVPNTFDRAARAARSSELYRRSADAARSRTPPDISPLQPEDAFSRDAAARLVEKGRDVSLYWLLHRARDLQVAAVTFVPLGDNLLGSIVLFEAGQAFFLDFPASLKEGTGRGGCWRVDDECRFGAETMDVPVVLGRPGERLVFYTSWGQEGQVIRLYQAWDGRLIELAGAYRYHLPV